MNELLGLSYMLLPLLVGLTFHGFCMKLKWLAFLIQPIDGGRMFRGKRLFGPNKTYRGVIAVGLGTALGFGIQAIALHQITSFRRFELIDYSSLNWFPSGSQWELRRCSVSCRIVSSSASLGLLQVMLGTASWAFYFTFSTR